MSKDDQIPGGVVITRNDIEKHKHRILDESMLVGTTEAATVLACSPRKVCDMVKAGDLTGYNNRGSGSRGLRVLAAELRDYVNSMRIDQDEWRG